MSLALRHQLTALDRALTNLLNERARLCREMVVECELPAPAVEDVLSRSRGEFPAGALRAVFEAVDAGSREAAGAVTR